MAYVVLARKYRPKSFEEVVGQQSVATTLKNAIKQKRLGHAYLFSGTRGIGKTTMARVLSMALNCKKGPTAKPDGKCDICKSIHAGEDLDVIEIDGASNRGIEEIRTLRENVRLAPARSPYKIYIIDEVHMLTAPAFNALLKTLEEPPSHVKFIFATTEPLKVPETIRSRCQYFEFRPLTDPQIKQTLASICEKEKIDIEDEVLDLITHIAAGSMRDALSTLDKLYSFSSGKIESKDASDVLGVVLEPCILDILESIKNRDPAKALAILDGVIAEGKSTEALFSRIIDYLRDLMVFQSCSVDGGTGFSDRRKEVLQNLSNDFSLETVLYLISSLNNTLSAMKRSPNTRILAEMQLIKLAKLDDIKSISKLVSSLDDIENKVAASEPAPSVRQAVPQTPAAAPAAQGRGLPPTKAASVSTVTGELKELMAHWGDILSSIRKDKMQVEAFVKEAVPLSMKDNLLVLGFTKEFGFHKVALESPEKKAVIENNILRVTGKRVRLELKSIGTAPEHPSFQKAASGESEGGKRGRPAQQDLDGEPLVRKAMDAFGGRVIK